MTTKNTHIAKYVGVQEDDGWYLEVDNQAPEIRHRRYQRPLRHNKLIGLAVTLKKIAVWNFSCSFNSWRDPSNMAVLIQSAYEFPFQVH